MVKKYELIPGKPFRIPRKAKKRLVRLLGAHGYATYRLLLKNDGGVDVHRLVSLLYFELPKYNVITAIAGEKLDTGELVYFNDSGEVLKAG